MALSIQRRAGRGGTVELPISTPPAPLGLARATTRESGIRQNQTQATTRSHVMSLCLARCHAQRPPNLGIEPNSKLLLYGTQLLSCMASLCVARCLTQHPPKLGLGTNNRLLFPRLTGHISHTR